MKSNQTRSSRKQRGAATIEYALIIAAVVAIAAVVFKAGGGETSLYDKITTKIKNIDLN